MQPNLIERLEHLIFTLEEADVRLHPGVFSMDKLPDIEGDVGNALGIATEILTMIDGR